MGGQHTPEDGRTLTNNAQGRRKRAAAKRKRENGRFSGKKKEVPDVRVRDTASCIGKRQYCQNGATEQQQAWGQETG